MAHATRLTEDQIGSNIQPLDPITVGPVSKPTSQEPLNIIIAGASFAGLSCSHYFLDNIVKSLGTTSIAPDYRLIVISPSTNIFWNIGAPRLLVGPGLLKHDDAFIPIEPGLRRHRGHNFVFLQGKISNMDTANREVSIKLLSPDAQHRMAGIIEPNQRFRDRGTLDFPDTQKLPYHALLLCTGTSADSDLLSLHGPHFNTLAALGTFHERLASARTVVICGGGPSGVESAGQMATWLNYKSHIPFLPQRYKRVAEPKRIILIVGGPRCLPQLKEKVSANAEKALRRLGVELRHDVRVKRTSTADATTGSTRIELDDGSEIIADAYLACTGVRPNTSFVPAALRNERGYVITNSETMRVEGAGERVYAVGDVASYSQNYVLDVYAAVPVAMHNLLNDLLKYELHLASPYNANEDRVAELEDLVYTQMPIESQLCPITRFGGAGQILNQTLPSAMVYLLKGHDYRVCKARRVVVDGGNPYAVKDKYQ